MILLMVKWYIKPGNTDQALAALAALAEAVQAGEPGTWIYRIHQPDASSIPPGPPGEIIFLEGYADQAALQAHVTGPAFTGFMAKYAGLFVAPFGGTTPYMVVEQADGFAGFIRQAAVTPS